jgi:hypothetical protein
MLTLATGVIIAAVVGILVSMPPSQWPSSMTAGRSDDPGPRSTPAVAISGQSPAVTTASPRDDRVPRCDSTSLDPPITGPRPDTSALSEYGQVDADEFGGLSWESSEVLVITFTDRLSKHEKAVRPLVPVGVELRLRQVAHTHDELVALVDRISDAMGAGDLPDVHVAGPSARLNRVQLEVSAPDPAIRDRLHARYGRDILDICVSEVPVVGPSF